LLLKGTTMTNPLLMQAMADDYRRARVADAARNRLIRLASCCRPSTVGRAAVRLRALVTHRTRAAACCA
jgi:hypothetical protein